MRKPQKYRVQIRQYPRTNGTTWRWWVFDRHSDIQIDTGVIVDGDRAAAPAYAIELLEEQSPTR